MKRILAGFLGFACLLLSLSARLPLLQESYSNSPRSAHPDAQKINNYEKFTEARFEIRIKYYKRLFEKIFIPIQGQTKIVHSWIHTDFPLYSAGLFSPLYLSSTRPRSPPVSF